MSGPFDLSAIVARAPVIPVVTIERAEDAEPLAEAILAGGLPAIEITLRTEAALAGAARARKAHPDLVLGIGTVMHPTQLEAARDLGADFAVSPGATPELLTAAQASGLPYMPGVATASEIMRLSAMGWTLVKFFPAQAAGGLIALRAFQPVFPAVRFCPTGGIDAANAADYLALDNVASVGGSWIAPAELVRRRDWEEIERRAAAASKLSAALPPASP